MFENMVRGEYVFSKATGIIEDALDISGWDACNMCIIKTDVAADQYLVPISYVKYLEPMTDTFKMAVDPD